MSLITCGINHKTAPLALREKLVFSKEQMPNPLLELVKIEAVSEVAILSTCNRTELYCADSKIDQVIQWLHDQQRLPPKTLESSLYIYEDKIAVQHLLRVATGLDSMVLGEPQIFGQLKEAYSIANTTGTIGRQLQRLFQYVFSITKQVRTKTEIGAHPVSIASASVELAQHIFADLSHCTALLIGAGEMIELALKHLQAAGVTKFIIANRHAERLEKYVQQCNATAISLQEIPDYLTQADIIIAATASPMPLVAKGAVERALKLRKHKIMFMVDLSVPRNIEPEIAELQDIYLYALDDLQTILQQNLHHRQTAAVEAEKIIDNYATHYIHTLNELDAFPIIKAYREKANEFSVRELAKIMAELKQDKISAEQALTKLAHRLTNKLLHEPTVQLREAALAEEQEFLLHAKKLFGLE